MNKERHGLFTMSLAAALSFLNGCSVHNNVPPITKNFETKSHEGVCINLSGKYAVSGKPLPGMPDYFKVRSIRPTMDVLLGLSSENRGNMRHAEISQNKRSLKFVFLKEDRPPVEKIFDPSNGLKTCDKDKVVIRQTMSGVGEAVSGTAIITTTLSVSETGALIMRVVFNWRNRTLFFFWNDRDEYAVEYPKR